MDYEPQPYVDADGTQIGWVCGVDGETYLTDLDFQIAGVWDPGEQDFFEPEDVQEPDPYEQRIAELEARVAEPRPLPEVQAMPATPRADMATFNQDMLRQRAQLERLLDRPLTLPEARALAGQMLDDFEAGASRPDIYRAAENIGGLADLDDDHPGRRREARVEWMTQRFQDAERMAAAGDNEDNLLDEQPPGSQDFYNADDREQRQRWMVEAMQGRATADQIYSPDDAAEQEL